MENIERITGSGVCTGCGACLGCEHLHMKPGALGFDIPVPDEGCRRCGRCVAACIFDPDREDDD